MSEKYQKLKKRVLIETGIMSFISVSLMVGIYFLSSTSDDYEESNSTLQKQVDAIETASKTLRTKYVNVQKNILDYNTVLKKFEENRLAINRQMVLEKFNQFKEKYNLASLHLTVSPAQEVKDAIFKHKNSGVNYSDVSADFLITSDEGVYELIDSLKDELPGITKLVKLQMQHDKPFNQQAFHEISQKGSFPMIKAELRFIWFGINYIPPADPKDKPGAANAPKN